MSVRVPPSGPDMSLCATGEVHFSVASIEAMDTDRASTLVCGRELPTWLGCSGVSDQVSANSGIHCDALLPSGGLGVWGSSAGQLHVQPSFTLIIGPVFSGE